MNAWILVLLYVCFFTFIKRGIYVDAVSPVEAVEPREQPRRKPENSISCPIIVFSSFLRKTWHFKESVCFSSEQKKRGEGKFFQEFGLPVSVLFVSMLNIRGTWLREFYLQVSGLVPSWLALARFLPRFVAFLCLLVNRFSSLKTKRTVLKWHSLFSTASYC